MSYREAYFYIQSEYSRMPSMWPNAEAVKTFRRETRRIFEGAGWNVEPGTDAISDTVRNGKQSLYLHPQHFSGPVLEKSIPEIEALLRNAKTFTYTGMRLYTTYREWSDEEYLSYLDTQKGAIANELLTRYKTSSRTRYLISGCNLGVADKFHIDRIDDPDRHHDLAYRYVSEVFDTLIEQGLLIKSPTGRGVRSAFKYEQKALQRQSKEAPHG